MVCASLAIWYILLLLLLISSVISVHSCIKLLLYHFCSLWMFVAMSKANTLSNHTHIHLGSSAMIFIVYHSTICVVYCCIKSCSSVIYGAYSWRFVVINEWLVISLNVIVPNCTHFFVEGIIHAYILNGIFCLIDIQLYHASASPDRDNTNGLEKIIVCCVKNCS